MAWPTTPEQLLPHLAGPGAGRQVGGEVDQLLGDAANIVGAGTGKSFTRALQAELKVYQEGRCDRSVDGAAEGAAWTMPEVARHACVGMLSTMASASGSE